MANTTEATSNITNGSNNTENKPSKIIKIQSNDGKIFKLDEDVIEQSSTIKELLASMLIYLENLIWMLLFHSALFVGDAPVELPNVKASLLLPVSYSSICIPINKRMLV